MPTRKIDLGPEGPEWFPWLLWLYNHGWEDPTWGTTPIGQVFIATTIHEMAGQIGDEATRREIQRVAAGEIAKLSRKLVEN